MNKFIVLFLVGMLAFAGCAKVPTVEVQNATAALDSLTVIGAEDYAPEALVAAQNAVAVMNAEVQAQSEKFSLFRSYKNTIKLALDAKTVADEGIVITNANKAQAKADAESALSLATAAYMDAESLVLTAPVGKGSELDIQLLKSDVAGVKVMLDDANNSIVVGKYKEALVKASATTNSANTISSEIKAAKEAKKR